MFRPKLDLTTNLVPISSEESALQLSEVEFKKRHKNKRRTLGIYHNAEKKALMRIHKEQLENTSISELENLRTHQNIETISLETLQSREKMILDNRLKLEKILR